MGRLRLAALALALAAAAAGCGTAGEDRPNASATLVLDSRPAAVHAGIELALERDFDDAEGVTLSVRAPTSPGDGLRRLLDGRAQFAILDIHDLALARQRGRDVVGVMALVQRPLEALLVQPGVRRPRDLSGRRVGVSGRRADTAIVDAIVRHDGGDPARVRRVVVGAGGAAAALRAGRVAAATGFWSAVGVSRAGIHAFRADDYGAPGYPELVLCVTRATLTDERGVVRATVAALRRGYDEALADPESAVEALVDRAPGLDRTATEGAFDTVSPAFLEGARRFGDLDRATLEAWARWEARERIVRRPPDVDRAFAFGI
jgi:putative hydroxymethylpyrimidine transport system substrate-binding protein